MDAKTAAQLEAEDLEDDELPSTVERADKARAEQRQAKENLERVEERERQIDQDRERLKDSIQIVHDLLRGGARTHQLIVTVTFFQADSAGCGGIICSILATIPLGMS